MKTKKRLEEQGEAQKPERKKPDAVSWLKRVEKLIALCSTKQHTEGKYTGHAETDTLRWITMLAQDLQKEIAIQSPEGGYDENMALASELGKVLCIWYAAVHRAKSYDINRPLVDRRKANLKVTEFRSELMFWMMDDWVMGQVWPNQVYNFPYGVGAAGGEFV